MDFFIQSEHPLHFNSNEAMQQEFLGDGFFEVSVTAPENYYDKLNKLTNSRHSLVCLVVGNV